MPRQLLSLCLLAVGFFTIAACAGGASGTSPQTSLSPVSTSTPALTRTATTATAEVATDAHGPWYTSDDSRATFYYCAADPGWKSLSANNLKSYPSEAALISAWPKRTKHAFTGC